MATFSDRVATLEFPLKLLAYKGLRPVQKLRRPLALSIYRYSAPLSLSNPHGSALPSLNNSAMVKARVPLTCLPKMKVLAYFGGCARCFGPSASYSSRGVRNIGI
jgi:hypothetical protein